MKDALRVLAEPTSVFYHQLMDALFAGDRRACMHSHLRNQLMDALLAGALALTLTPTLIPTLTLTRAATWR